MLSFRNSQQEQKGDGERLNIMTVKEVFINYCETSSPGTLSYLFPALLRY